MNTLNRGLTYGGTAAAAFVLGLVMTPAPAVIPVRGETVVEKTVIERIVEIPEPAVEKPVIRTVLVEKEPTPRAFDCVVGTWR